ncbi:MAG: hypothetical protein NVS4B2_31480 [Chloroflexota bacterium]
MVTVLDEKALQTALEEPTIWPNLTQAATITGLSKGTLSKQAQARRISSEVRGFGHAERVVPPREVLRIGHAYRRISQETLIERLATFLVGRLSVDVPLVQHVLQALMESIGPGPSPSRSDLSQPGGAADELEPPKWLTDVERLRENPHALAGTIAFTSADDVIGTLELGPSVDDLSEADVVAWKARW